MAKVFIASRHDCLGYGYRHRPGVGSTSTASERFEAGLDTEDGVRDAALLMEVFDTFAVVRVDLDDLRDVREVGSLSVMMVVSNVVVLVVVLYSSPSAGSVSSVASSRLSARASSCARAKIMGSRLALASILSMASGWIRVMGTMTNAVDEPGMLEVGDSTWIDMVRWLAEAATGMRADDVTADMDREYTIELEARGAKILVGEGAADGDKEVGFGQTKLLARLDLLSTVVLIITWEF